MKNTETEKKVETKLTFKTFYGNLYFLLSAIMTVVAIAMSITAGVTHNFAFIWVLVGVGIAYCAALFFFEVKRVREIKQEQKDIDEINKEIA